MRTRGDDRIATWGSATIAIIEAERLRQLNRDHSHKPPAIDVPMRFMIAGFVAGPSTLRSLEGGEQGSLGTCPLVCTQCHFVP